MSSITSTADEILFLGSAIPTLLVKANVYTIFNGYFFIFSPLSRTVHNTL